MARMRAVCISACVLWPTLLAAQSQSEFGTTFGVAVLRESGSSITYIAVPGSGIWANPTLYFTYFSTPSVLIEPQFGFQVATSSGGSATTVRFAVQVGSLQHPHRKGSTYVAVNGALQSVDLGGGAASGVALGGAVGYRARVGRGLAIRVEGRYRRWFGDYKGVNEFGLAIGVAGII